MILALLACLDDFPDRHADFDGDGIPADEDCDDTSAEIGVASLWYTDADGDGHGGDKSLVTCHPQSNAVTSTGDCEDNEAANYPGNEEVCDERDNDCNAQVDDVAASSPEANVGYPDVDGDTFGDVNALESVSCDIRLPDNTDCDDTDSAVHPGAVEVCGDFVDTDCDGSCDDCCFENFKDPGNIVRGSALTLLSRDETVLVGPTLLTGDLFAESRTAFAAGSSVDGTVYAVPAAAIPEGAEQIEIDVGVPEDLETIAVVRGSTEGDLFGASLATLDSGPRVDLLIGAPNAQQIGSLATAGAVYLVSGPLSAGTNVSVGEKEVAFYGDPALNGTHFGSNLLTGFDFDGDEISDVVVSGVGGTSDEGPGAVWVFYDVPSVATSSASILGTEDADAFGASLAAGDLDGDDVDDLVVGRTNSTTPEVCVFFGGGRFGPMDSDAADLAFVSFVNAANLGSSLAIGDLDGDGWPDVAAGANEPGKIGTQNATVRAFLNQGDFASPKNDEISLDSSDLTFVGTDRDLTGTALVARDFDGDLVDDLLIGAPGVIGGGLAYLVRMPQTGGIGPGDTSTFWSMGPAGPGGELGTRLGAGLLDSDEWPDVLLAEPFLRSVYAYKNLGIW